MKVQEWLESRSNCRSVDELKHLVQIDIESFGYGRFNLFCATDSADGTSFRGIDNLPANYHPALNDSNLARIDPVMQHCKYRHVPIAWTQATYVGDGLQDKWEHMAAHGMSSGVAVAMHMPLGHHLFVGVYDDRADGGGVDRQTRLAASLQLLASCIAEPVRTLLGAPISGCVPRLTSRERECLLWALEGKSVWSTATILSISESRVSKVIKQAMDKLGCTTKGQAIGKALRLGLLR